MLQEKFDLTNHCSIITGAAQGLGESMARGLAEAGSNIVIADINIQKARQVASEVGELGVTAIAVKMDVTKKSEIDDMVTTVMDKFGKIDVLINNAGIVKTIDLIDMEYQDWLDVINVNLNGVFLVSQSVGKVMIGQKRGSIINISSMSGIVVNTPQSQSSYNASKAGVIMLTKSMASEWAQYNIRVNTIAPGYMNVGDVEPYFREKRGIVKTWLSMTPMGRPGEPDELQGIAVYLASEASSFVTGGVFSIDGGYTIW